MAAKIIGTSVLLTNGAMSLGTFTERAPLPVNDPKVMFSDTRVSGLQEILQDLEICLAVTALMMWPPHYYASLGTEPFS